MATDLNKLFDTLQSIKTSTGATTPAVAPYIPYVGAAQSAQAPDNGLFATIAQGGINAVGGLLRAVTSIGRANTNMANDILPYANRVFKLTEDGLTPDELQPYLSEVWNGTWAGLGGFAKGLTYSFLPPEQQTRDNLRNFFGGETPVEGGYDLFQTQSYKDAQKNLPFLRQTSSEQKVGEIPNFIPFDIPFLGIEKGKGMPVTPAGLWSFGWDVATDPFSFMTMGLGGAAKGAAKAVGTVVTGSKLKAAAAKGGRDLSVEELQKVAPPTLYKQAPEKTVPYNVMETNPLIYIGKEMGRGFVDSHRAAAARISARSEARAAKRVIAQEFGRMAEERLSKVGADADFSYTQTLADVAANVQARLKQAAEASGKSAEETALIVGRQMGILESQIPDILAKAEAKGFANLTELRARAQAEGMTIGKRMEADLLDEAARKFAGTTPAIARLSGAKYDAAQVENLGNMARTAADSPDGNIAAAWDEFRANADAGTVRQTLQRLINPLGSHEPKPKPGQPKKTSLEEREMMKRLSAIQKQKLGAGSEALSKQGKLPTVDKKSLLDSPLALRKALLGLGDTKAAEKQLLDNAMDLTGEQLQAAIAQAPNGLRVMGERLQYMGLTGQSRPSAAFQYITSLVDKKYNPFTFEVGSRSINEFAVTAEGRAGGIATLSEITRLSQKATGRWYPERLGELLRKAGIKDRELLSGDAATNAQNFIEIAIFRNIEAKTTAARQQILRTSYERFSLEELMTKGIEFRVDDVHLAEISKRAAALGRNSVRLSDDEIKEMVELAGLTKDEQIKSLERLKELGLNPYTQAGRVRTEVIGAREIAARQAAEAQTRTGYAPTKELQEVQEVRRAVNAVKEASKGDAPLEGAALASVFEKAFFSKLPKDKTTKEILQLGKQLRDIIKGKEGISVPRVRQALFSQLENVISTTERGFSRATTTGFDFVFTDATGKYVQSAVANQMAFLYAGSRAANSIDGGYFARYVDEQLLAGRADLPEGLSSVRTHAEKVTILNSVAQNWGGEGITFGVLQDALRAAKSRSMGGEGLSPVERKTFEGILTQTIKKFEDATIEEIKRTGIERILIEEKMSFRPGWIERLPETEQAIARQKLANEVFTIDPEMAKAAGLTTNKLAYKQIADYMPGGKRVEISKNNSAVARVADEVARRANAAARDAVETSRAWAKFQEVMPAWASREELAKLANLGSMARATGALQSTMMLANMITRTEVVAKVADANAAIANKVAGKTIESISKEKKFLEGIIRRLESKFYKEGYKPVKGDLTGKSLDEVIAMESPIAFLKWARTFTVEDAAARDTWAKAMQHMLNLEVTGKGSAYRTAKELFESYRKGGDDIRPATPLEVVETIAALGNDVPVGKKAQGYLNHKGLPQRRTILKLIDEAAPILDKSEIERARGASWIKEVNLVGGKEVQAAVDSIPDIAMTPQKAYENLAGTLAELEALGLGWIPTLSMQSVGDSVRQFFVHRAEYFEKTTIDKLGRPIDQYLLPGATRSSYLKKSWEDYTNYTGFKTMVSTIRDMAPTAKKGKLTEDQWVAKMTRLAMSVRDNYLLARGIVPVHTISLKTGEAIPNGLASALGKGGEAVDDLNLTAVALTENDIMDLLPEQDVVDLFFSGRVQSMPPTAVLPAARLLVAAMESLPEGAYFNAEQLVALQKHMFETAMIGAKAASTSEFAKISWMNLAPEEASASIRVLVERLLDPDTATRLYEKHLANSTYATGILKYEAGQLSERVMAKWSEIAASPIASSSDRIKATLDAMSELNDMLKIADAGSEAERVMAALDMQALLAKEIDVDSLFDIQTANKIAKAGRVVSGEEAKISNLQQALRQKRGQDAVNKALVEAMEAREPLLSDMYAQKIIAMEKNGIKPGIDDQYMLFNDIITDQGKLPWYLNFTDTGLRAFSFDYQKANIAPYLGGFERKAIEDASEYTNVAVNYSVKWAREMERTGKNYPEMAFKILQQVEDADLPRVALSADTIMKLTSRTARETVSPDDIGALKAAMDHIEFFKNLRNKDGELLIPGDDPMLVQAIADLWRFGGHFFGENGKIVRAGVPAQWLNTNLRQIGSSEVKQSFNDAGELIKVKDGFGFNPNTTTPSELSQQWRDWDILNPYQMFSTLNSAFARSEKLMQEAAYVQKAHGIKVSDFARQGETAAETAARAKAEGLIKIEETASLKQQGRELIYFMNTKDYYYNADIAAQIIKASNDLTAPYRVLEDVRKFAAKFDELQNFAKRSMTIFRLGNFIMNFNGGLWTNFLGGVMSPVAYYRSFLALQHLHPNLRDLPVQLDKLEEQVVRYHAKRTSEGFTVRPEADPVSNKASMPVVVKSTAAQYQYSELANLYRAIGGETPVASSRNLDLLGDFGSAEFLQKHAGTGLGKSVKRIYEKMSLGIGRAAAVRDDYIRMTMWLDELSKGNWPSLEVGAREALKKVDRYHPQMQDLSRFNNNVTRQFIMFFVWQAKTLGWIVNDIMDKPGLITATLRAQYAMQTAEGNQPEYFGSFDPKGVLLRDYQQGNMNFLTGNLGYGFSAANPVTDLLGSNGWLSQINYKSYESPTTNLMTSTVGSMQQFLYGSSPLFANFVIAWAAGRTAGGQDLLRSGSFNEESLAILSEEIAGQLGLTLPHAAMALAFPDQLSRQSWDKETTLTEKQKDTLRYLFNWMTGMRAQEYLSYDQRQKAVSELKSTLNRVLENQAK